MSNNYCRNFMLLDCPMGQLRVLIYADLWFFSWKVGKISWLNIIIHLYASIVPYWVPNEGRIPNWSFRSFPQPLLFLVLKKSQIFYSVMQSDGNNICGNVVFNSFNKASRDKDNTLDQVYKSKYDRIFIMMILILYNIIRKCTLTQQ